MYEDCHAVESRLTIHNDDELRRLMQQTSPRRPFPIHVLVFLAPAVLLYSLFMVFPLINSLRLSFYTISEQNQISFNGLQNYIKLFTDSDFAPFFWGALKNNFVFFAIHMLVQN